MEVEQQPTGVPDGWSVVPPTAPPARTQGHDFKVLGINIHVPGEEKPRPDSNILGWGDQGAGIAPEDALAAGSVVRSVAGAASGGMLAGVKAAVAQAAPVVKYEIIKTAFEKAGLPSSIAIPAAMAASGYRRGVKAAPAAVETAVAEAPLRPPPNTTGTSFSPAPMPVPSGGPPASAPVVQGPPAAVTVPVPTAPPPTAATPSGSGLPDQKALNEAALAARRAAYQQRLAAETAQATQASTGNVMAAASELTTEEKKALFDLVSRGVPGPDAVKNILAQRALRTQFNLTTPSEADIRFPKGMRGKPPER